MVGIVDPKMRQRRLVELNVIEQVPNYSSLMNYICMNSVLTFSKLLLYKGGEWRLIYKSGIASKMFFVICDDHLYFPYFFCHVQ